MLYYQEISDLALCIQNATHLNLINVMEGASSSAMFDSIFLRHKETTTYLSIPLAIQAWLQEPVIHSSNNLELRKQLLPHINPNGGLALLSQDKALSINIINRLQIFDKLSFTYYNYMQGERTPLLKKYHHLLMSSMVSLMQAGVNIFHQPYNNNGHIPWLSLAGKWPLTSLNTLLNQAQLPHKLLLRELFRPRTGEFSLMEASIIKRGMPFLDYCAIRRIPILYSEKLVGQLGKMGGDDIVMRMLQTDLIDINPITQWNSAHQKIADSIRPISDSALLSYLRVKQSQWQANNLEWKLEDTEFPLEENPTLTTTASDTVSTIKEQLFQAPTLVFITIVLIGIGLYQLKQYRRNNKTNKPRSRERGKTGLWNCCRCRCNGTKRHPSVPKKS